MNKERRSDLWVNKPGEIIWLKVRKNWLGITAILLAIALGLCIFYIIYLFNLVKLQGWR